MQNITRNQRGRKLTREQLLMRIAREEYEQAEREAERNEMAGLVMLIQRNDYSQE